MNERKKAGARCALLAALLTGAAVWAALLPAGERAQRAQVAVCRLSAGTVERTVSCTGTVEAGELRGICPDAACIVAEVAVKKGQSVRAGDVLLRIDKAATRAAQADGTRQQDALALAAMPDTVVAPADGVVTAVEAAAGGWISPQAPCVLLAAREDTRVRIAIREKDLPQVAVGQTVYVRGDGFSRRRYRGHLAEIAAAAKTVSGGTETVVEGVVELDAGAADASLRFGLTARAEIVTAADGGRVVVPYEAIGADDDGQEYVLLLQNGTAVRQDIAPERELKNGALLDAAQSRQLSGQDAVRQPEQIKSGARVRAAEGTR